MKVTPFLFAVRIFQHLVSISDTAINNAGRELVTHTLPASESDAVAFSSEPFMPLQQPTRPGWCLPAPVDRVYSNFAIA